MLVCLIVFAGLLCTKMIGFIVASAETDQMFEQNVASISADMQEIEPDDNSQRIAQELIENNMFMITEEKSCPIKDVNAIMGKEVLIHGQWYKVGEEVGDAIILEIGASYAKVKWRDTEKIIGLSNEIPKIIFRQPGRGTAPRVNQVLRIQVPDSSQQTTAATQNQQDSLAWMGMQLTAEQRQKVETVWSRVPEQLRSVMQQQWANMPEAERTRSLQQLDQISTAQLEQLINQRLGQLQ